MPTLWLAWIVAVIGFMGVVVLIENRRGSRGAGILEDRHLNRPDRRGGPSGHVEP